jgi:S1-C subfamily serine protease
MSVLEDKHEKMLYPTVRVRTDQAGGSGTVIYSKLLPGETKKYETYILTNCHVVSANIKVEKKWSTLLKREVKTDILSECSVEFFNFEYGSWESGQNTYRSEIMCYDKDMDLALLRLKTERKIDHVATMFPKGQHKERLRMFMNLYAVGCGLGHPPLATRGNLTGFNDIIDNYPYFLSTAATIFGNSGGAIFLDETYEFIGVPSRVAVSISGFSADAITHLSYFIPIMSIYRFIKDQIFTFIYDLDVTSKECKNRRKEKRERDEKMMAIDISRDSKE